MPKLALLNLSTLNELDCSEMTLVIPFSSLEPLGETLPFNTFQRVTGAIADKLSEREEFLVAPQITTPFATPLKGFRGVLSLRRTVFMNQLADMVLSSLSWGIKRVLFLDGTCYSKQTVDQAMKKYKRKLPEDFTYGVVAWQSDSNLNRAVKDGAADLSEHWRSEAAAALLFSELTGEAVPQNISPNKNISSQLFEQWRRRGRDPERLVKYFPNAALSSWSSLAPKEPLLPILINSITDTLEKGYIYHGF